MFEQDKMRVRVLARNGDPEASRIFGFIEGAAAAAQFTPEKLQSKVEETVSAFVESRVPLSKRV